MSYKARSKTKGLKIMIKVVQVSSDSNIGGAGKCILTFLKSFDRTKFDVSVIIPKDSLLKPYIDGLSVKVYEAENIAEKSLSRSGITELMKLLKSIKPDIVHTHASMSARIAAKRLGIKTVYTRHSVFEPPKKISKGVGKMINGFVNNHTADRIIAVAEAAKDNLTATGVNPDKIQVVLNGVDPLQRLDERTLDEFRKKYGINENTKTASIIARLTEVKGQRYFVEAAETVLKKGIDAKFFIAGTGDTAEELKRQISDLGLEKNVIMLGFLNDVTPIMNMTDVQVNCSFGTEATSLSLLEGMSIGKPAVVTDFGGNPGVIKNGVNGYLVPTHNSKALAEKLCMLFEDDELYAKLSDNALNIYNECFTSLVYTRNIEKIYSEMI